MRRTSIRNVSTLAIAVLAFWVAAARPADADFVTPTAITNVTIVVEPGLRTPTGTILIDDGRIVGVGENVDPPDHAEIVDATGLIAYPGFIDAHVHLGVTDKKRTVDQRRRTEDINPDVRQSPLPATRLANRGGIRPEFRAIELLTADEKTFKSHRSAGFTAALIAPRDGILGGTGDLVELSGLPIRRSVLAPRVAMHGSFEKGEDGDYPLSLLGVFAQFRQAMLDAQWYSRLHKYCERHPTTAPRAPTDQALEALQPVLRRTRPLIFEANTENEIHRALNLAAEFNLRLIISGGKEAWKVADRLKAERVPVIATIKFDEEPEYGKKKPDAERDEVLNRYEPVRVREERRRRWEEQVANLVRLHESGVAFALRTRDFKDPSRFFKNLRMVIERGLPEDAALEALTTTPAFLFRMSDQLGAIRRSGLGNLTLMTAPLSEADAEVKMVFIGGRKFDVMDDDEKKESAEQNGEKDPQAARAESEPPQSSTDADGDTEVTEDRSESDGPDLGPTFETELEKDRVPRTRTGGDVLITNATVLPVSSPPLTDASILVRDGKIARIGRIGSVPDGVTVIDASGRFVMPGIIDCHSHLGLDGINEPSVAISAEVRVADVIDPHSVAIYRALAGGVTTHHALHGSSNPIGGQNVIFKLKYGRPASQMLISDAPRTIKFATGENVTHANWSEQRGKRFPNSRMGVEAVYRMALEAGRQYGLRWGAYERAARDGADVEPMRRDLRLEALADIVAGELAVHPHCYRSDEILRLIVVAEDYGFRIGTLQHVLEGYRVAPEIARHGCGASVFADLWAYKMEAYGGIPHNAALMTRHGINVSVNSDSSRRIRYLNLEAAKTMRSGGLDADQALALVTLNPARQLQLDHRIGSLETGKDADIAIFNGHPLSAFSKCVMTLIDGEVYFEDRRPQPTEPCETPSVPEAVDRTIPDAPRGVYAITNATVHPISAPVIENATVVVAGDSIDAVGSNVPVPQGAGVIDATGLHVYPGLIDAGSRLGLMEIWMIAATRDYNDTPSLRPHLRASTAVHPHSEHVRITRTVGITTALTAPSGGRISGQSAVIHLDGWTAPEMLLLDDYALHMTVPSLSIHLSKDTKEKRTKEHKEELRELEAFIAKARHYARVKDLAGTDADVDFELDLTLEAMIPFVRGEKPVVFNVGEYKEMLDTIAFAEKHGLKCIFSGATQAWKLADTLAEKDIPVILATPMSYPQGEFEPWDSVYRGAGVLDRAGVPFCFASGSAASAYELPLQAGMAVAHGLPRERAEFALTLGAAQILGIADRVGSIEPGKQADLIVTTGTPLQAATQVTHMFIGGRPIELTSKHTESYERFKNRPEPDLPPARTDLVGPPSRTGR
ncbi:MAG: amidohydrolase family protein [Phycisphaerae bacterium]|jgi:imidazolonepropionase-like amidohydrolase